MKRALTAFALILATIITVSCNSTKTKTSQMPMDILTSKTWVLSSLNGQAPDPAKFSRGLPDATFTKEYKVSGNGGCNRYSGAYNFNDDGGVNVSEVISTKMYCEGSGEGEFFKAIGEVNKGKIDTDKLTLYNGVKEIMVFVPKQ